MIFRIASCSSEFFPGKDSKNADEYWLQAHDPRSGNGEFQLNQFHSPDLSKWLTRFDLPGESK